MFFLKIIGSLIIITSSSLMGFQYGGRYSKRLSNLHYFKNCLQLLETEIMYSATPLPMALENVHKKGNKKVSFIFIKIKEHLLNSKGAGISDSFNYVSNDLKNILFLDKEDIEVILALGNILGSTNRSEQEKHLRLIGIQLDQRIKEAEKKKTQHERLYKNLGVLMGVLIVIILI